MIPPRSRACVTTSRMSWTRFTPRTARTATATPPGLAMARKPPGDGYRPGAARHGRPRPGSVNRAGAAALTAVAVVGTGVSAGVFGIVPFLSPAATAPHVTSRAAAAGPRAPDGVRARSPGPAPRRLHRQAPETGSGRAQPHRRRQRWWLPRRRRRRPRQARSGRRHAAGGLAAGVSERASAPASPPRRRRPGASTGTGTGQQQRRSRPGRRPASAGSPGWSTA